MLTILELHAQIKGVTSNDIKWLSKIFNDMKHRAASLWQPSFLFYLCRHYVMTMSLLWHHYHLELFHLSNNFLLRMYHLNSILKWYHSKPSGQI